MENMTKEKREEIIEKAKDKLKAEEKSGKYGVKENAMKGEVLKALAAFAEQDVEFAEAIIQKSQTFADCMASVAKDVGSSISDLDAYKKAVQFYFPGAEIEFQMKIYVNPFDKAGGGKENIKTLSLLDILG